MRGAAPERSQERLPPKKRDLPTAEGLRGRERAGGGGGGSGGEAPSASPSGWGRGAGGGGGPEGAGAEQQFGLLYKVAPPPPPPPAFSVASPLLQPPGLPYSPVHYAQLPPAPLHFVGAPFAALPYAAAALPPAFLPPGALLPAGRLPHFVPYASLLLEEAAPPPPPAHGFGKAQAPLALQPPGAPQGTFPLHYQLSQLPAAAGYSAFEVPVAGQSSELPRQDAQLLTANGSLERPPLGAKGSRVLEVGRGSPEGHLPRTAAESLASASCQSLGAEVSLTSRRSTPDTDLEVQRVVGVFASQGYLACSGQQKDSVSPLNLSHRDLPEHGEESSGRDPGPGTAEKSCPQRLPAKSPEELLYHHQILRGLTMANGKAVSGSLPPATHDGLGRASPEALVDLDRASSQGHLPSHFMKGAIIQLATGELKRVEDLQTQDFVRSAEVSGGLKIDSSTVVDLQESPWQGFVTLHFVVGEQQSKVSIDVPPEHPFFVYGQGWSSCSPERTARLFALPCHRLQVGDVCISISLQSLNGRLAPQAPQGAPGERLGRGSQDFRDPQARAGGGSPMLKGGPASLGSPPEPFPLEPTSQHGWAGPGLQRFGEEPRSFIPQEVKLCIEGRSNAGK